MARKDITGMKFNRLTAIAYAGKALNRGGKSQWRFRCDCGNEVVRDLTYVITGVTQSCGCLRREMSAERMSKIARREMSAERMSERMSKIATRLPSGEAAFNSMYTSRKRSAKKSEVEWALTKEEFRRVTSAPCAQCGKPPSVKIAVKGARGPYITSYIARIDVEEGWSIDNVVPLCRYHHQIKVQDNQVEGRRINESWN